MRSPFHEMEGAKLVDEDDNTHHQCKEHQQHSPCLLQDSVVTRASTETESVISSDDKTTSDDEGGWLGGIGADFRTLAVTITGAAGGVANFVHRSALTVAAEIAHDFEEDEDDDDEYDDNDDDNMDSSTPNAGGVKGRRRKNREPLRLPWEVRVPNSDGSESLVFEENVDLKRKIFALSTMEINFMQPYTSQDAQDSTGKAFFLLNEPRIKLIQRLLELDANLATTHSRLSGRNNVRETVFWRNYFHNCDEMRQDYLKKQYVELSPQSTCTEDDADDGEDSAQNSWIADNEDSDSLDDDDQDDSSFINVPTPPASFNSAGIRSINSLVFIEQVNQATRDA